MEKKQKNPNRIAKVNATIQQALGPILLEFLSEEKGLVTISKVETSRDMKWCKVWISIFDGNPHPPLDASGRGEKGYSALDQRILELLQKNIYHLQGELNKHFFSKIIPRLQFFLDTAPRYAQHIEEVIKKIHEEK